VNNSVLARAGRRTKSKEPPTLVTGLVDSVPGKRRQVYKKTKKQRGLADKIPSDDRSQSGQKNFGPWWWGKVVEGQEEGKP